jgi:hypothetical protein
MALDKDKILADLKAAAKPELEKRAQELRATFLKNVDDFVDSSRVKVLDDLMAKAAKYEIEAVMASDPDTARQYATAAEDVLRQVSVILVTEKVVAEKKIAAMIQAAALSVWEGFKSVATGLLGVAIKGALTGLLGPAGGAVADAAGTFLGQAVGGGNPGPAGSNPGT